MNPLDGIIFEDDIFIIDKNWLAEFAVKYRKNRITIYVLCAP